ncbi:MAG: iron ABC transporter permease [candidate division NC10 bacterium]|nr:iron ABC transporter permease [candidate division NC10 bacterium]MBI3086036.1 iron ABC transporter permease [candidate division NC10 bacterium]OGB92251.1 MAG: hypothetical protein A3H39_17430 [candidate division NC10 bacterium RIFCSPLOWO2_02_FULL_66_22]
MSRASAYAVSLGTAVLLMLFVIMPLGAVLIESVRLRGPLTPREMRTAVLAALERLEPEPRRTLLARWGDEVTPAQRMEATAATLEAMNLRVLWDRKAPFDQQIAAAEAAVTGLTENQRAAFTAEFPVQVAVLHKRIALAFRVRDRLSPAEFDTLRSGTRSGFGLTHYREFLGDPRLRRAGLHSLFVATTASLISMVLAYALAFAVNRRGTRVPSLVRFTVLTPLVSPPIIMALAGILLFGRQGLITRGLLQERLGLIDADVTNLYGVSGVIVAMVLSFLPHAFIILDDVLARHDGRVEEAAASQGATAWQIFWRVTLPLTRPGVIRAALVVFILSMTDFGNPLVIGRGYSVLAGVVYDEIIGYQNSSLAAALCVWLILPTLTAYFLFERSERRKRFATGAATGGPPELPLSAMARLGLGTAAAAVCATIVLFYGVIVLGSFTRVWGVDFTPTLEHYRWQGAEAYSGVGAAQRLPLIWSSVKIAGMAALAGGIFSVMIAYLVERVRPTGRNVLGFIALLPGVVPGVIFGVGYLVAFNNPLGIRELALTGTAAILVLNILFANIFVGVLAGRATLQRLDPAVDEAAEILGATLGQKFFLVTVPMIRHVLVLATLYIFVHGLVTLSAVIFLVSPDHNLASVGIFLNADTGRYGLAASMSVAILVIVTAVMGLIWLAERHGPAWARVRLAGG